MIPGTVIQHNVPPSAIETPKCFYDQLQVRELKHQKADERRSLFKDDFGRSFAVHSEAAVWKLDDGAHGLPLGVEGVHLVEFLLWDLVPDGLVVSFQVQDQTQQPALGFVAHLFGKTSFLIWRLEWKKAREDSDTCCMVTH